LESVVFKLFGECERFAVDTLAAEKSFVAIERRSKSLNVEIL